MIAFMVLLTFGFGAGAIVEAICQRWISFAHIALWVLVVLWAFAIVYNYGKAGG